jgi:hypothetical protein
LKVRDYDPLRFLKSIQVSEKLLSIRLEPCVRQAEFGFHEMHRQDSQYENADAFLHWTWVSLNLQM